MDMILLGLPGAGKGTQAKKISKEFDLPHIATGDIFRQAIRDKTTMGREAKKFLNAGELVPDEVTIGIVKDRLNKKDCDKGFILDGFPRTLNQAEALDDILEEMNNKLDLALYINVAEEKLIKRLSGRRICEDCGASYHMQFNPPKEDGICDKCGGKLIQRSDDQEDTVINRIKVNKKQMQDLLDYYTDKDILQKIESTGGINEVFTDISQILKELG